MLNDRPAVQAQEEYDKAVIAFHQGEPAHAAFYLGAMASSAWSAIQSCVA
jgi:glucose-6-phosphate dehydrogenase assembly protein OpcA